MNFRTPIAATILTLGLTCAPAFAGPANAFQAPSAQASSAMAQQSGSQHLVATVRKVYSFSKLDRNHNEMLTRSEIPADMTKLRINFARADFDHNGQLSREEYYLYSHGLTPSYVGPYHAHIVVNDHHNPTVESISMVR